MATALYPGAFKPPHRGHFNVVKNLLNGNHKGKLYTYDDATQAGQDALGGKSDKVDPINKVVVFIGAKDRNGISTKESLAIWNIYKKYLGDVEFYYEASNPMQNASAYAKKRPDEKFYAITGIRSEEDMIDLKRISTFKNRENTQGLIIPAPGGTRATDLRSVILSGNLDSIRDYFPEELSREELNQIIDILRDSIIAELLASNVDGYLAEYFGTNSEMDSLPPLEETSSTTPISPNGPTRSADRNRLVQVYNYLNNLIPTGTEIKFNQDHIRISIKGQGDSPEFDYTPFMSSILEYMIDEGMNITPLPEIKIKKDLAEAVDFFGRTAYYDPNNKEIMLYTMNRHPKDVMRSFAHEMVHHMQNVEGRLGEITTSNTNESDALLELEKEAYLTGNITFRNWEDSVKNQPQEDVDGKKAFSKEVQLSEGRYDGITNKLSSIAFEAFKDAYDRGDKKAEFQFRVGHPDDPETDIPSTKFETDFIGIARFNDDTYKVDGGANAGIDDDGEEIQPMLHLNFDIPKDPNWQEVSMDIKDVVRHELEHLTQDGENLRQGKYMPDDQDLRNLMDAGLLDKDLYFELEKEVDAMLQGLYFKAKKSKQPFAKVVNDYLDKAMISLDNKEKVLILWRKRLPALGIKQRL